MKKIRKKGKKNLLVAGLVFLVVVGVGYAAFADRAEILGTSVSVGSADIKFLEDLSGGVGEENLADSKSGPNFENIYEGWVYDYPIKIFNNGTSELILTSNADYETANDPESLRSDLMVEPFVWDDTNGDGVVDTGELGASLTQKTIIKWKTEGFELGNLSTGGVAGFVLRFSAPSISESKQGASAVFDFLFDAAELVE